MFNWDILQLTFGFYFVIVSYFWCTWMSISCPFFSPWTLTQTVSLSFSVFPPTSGFLFLWPSLLLCRLTPISSYPEAWAPKLGTLLWCWWFSGAGWIVLNLFIYCDELFTRVPCSFRILLFVIHGRLCRPSQGLRICLSLCLGMWCHAGFLSPRGTVTLVTKGGMEPTWEAIFTGETNGYLSWEPTWKATVTGETNRYWPVTGAASPVWLARATAQTRGQSLAGMASDRGPGSPLAPGKECEDIAGWCSCLMQLCVLSFD